MKSFPRVMQKYIHSRGMRRPKLRWSPRTSPKSSWSNINWNNNNKKKSHENTFFEAPCFKNHEKWFVPSENRTIRRWKTPNLKIHCKKLQAMIQLANNSPWTYPLAPELALFKPFFPPPALSWKSSSLLKVVELLPKNLSLSDRCKSETGRTSMALARRASILLCSSRLLTLENCVWTTAGPCCLVFDAYDWTGNRRVSALELPVPPDDKWWWGLGLIRLHSGSSVGCCIIKYFNYIYDSSLFFEKQKAPFIPVYIPYYIYEIFTIRIQ